MANFYCEYCGISRPTVDNLTASTCPRHPDGAHKGKHKLYEGSEKKEYTCKYCGTKRPTIQNLVDSSCTRHPLGPHKGKHAPAL